MTNFNQAGIKLGSCWDNEFQSGWDQVGMINSDHDGAGWDD